MADKSSDARFESCARALVTSPPLPTPTACRKKGIVCEPVPPGDRKLYLPTESHCQAAGKECAAPHSISSTSAETIPSCRPRYQLDRQPASLAAESSSASFRRSDRASRRSTLPRRRQGLHVTSSLGDPRRAPSGKYTEALPPQSGRHVRLGVC